MNLNFKSFQLCAVLVNVMVCSANNRNQNAKQVKSSSHYSTWYDSPYFLQNSRQYGTYHSDFTWAPPRNHSSNSQMHYFNVPTSFNQFATHSTQDYTSPHVYDFSEPQLPELNNMLHLPIPISKGTRKEATSPEGSGSLMTMTGDESHHAEAHKNPEKHPIPINYLNKLIGVTGHSHTLGAFYREYIQHVINDLLFLFFRWVVLLYAGLLLP